MSMPTRPRRPRRRSYPFLGAVILALLTGGACSSSDSGSATTNGGEETHVGILQLSQATLISSIVENFKAQLTKDLGSRKVVFDVHNAQGDDGLIQSIARQLHESNDDMFAVAGTPGIVALHQIETKRPIIGLAMTDPVQAKVAESETRSGTNVTGSLGYVPPAKILDEVLQVRPTPRVIGTVYDPSNQASQIWVREFKTALAGHSGRDLVEATISGPGDIASAAASLRGRADTWVIPPDTTVAAGLPAVGAAALRAKAALFVTAGDATTAGVAASIGPDYAALGRLAASNAVAVVRGRKPGDVPFTQPTGAELKANDQTVQALHLVLPSSAPAK